MMHSETVWSPSLGDQMLLEIASIAAALLVQVAFLTTAVSDIRRAQWAWAYAAGGMGTGAESVVLAGTSVWCVLGVASANLHATSDPLAWIYSRIHFCASSTVGERAWNCFKYRNRNVLGFMAIAFRRRVMHHRKADTCAEHGNEAREDCTMLSHFTFPTKTDSNGKHATLHYTTLFSIFDFGSIKFSFHWITCIEVSSSPYIPYQPVVLSLSQWHSVQLLQLSMNFSCHYGIEASLQGKYACGHAGVNCQEASSSPLPTQTLLYIAHHEITLLKVTKYFSLSSSSIPPSH